MTERLNPTPKQYSETDSSTWPLERQLQKLSKKRAHLNQDTVYQELRETLPPEEIIEKIIEDMGETTGKKTIMEIQKKLGEKFVHLFIEPSISTRYDMFLQFTSNLQQKWKNVTPSEARSAFKDVLGKKRVYRMAALNDGDLKKILADGFIANFYRNRSPLSLSTNTDPYQSIEYGFTDLQARVNIHTIWADTRDSLLISVSEFPAMAQYAAFVKLQKQLQNLEATGHRFYLFPIDIEEFYLIRLRKFLKNKVGGTLGFWINGEHKIPYKSEGVEALIEFHIPPHTIAHNEIQQLNPHKIPNFKKVEKV